jgi:hypothetical protein
MLCVLNLACAFAAPDEADESDADVCCICLDTFLIGKAQFITECGHKFHFSCIKKYCDRGDLDQAKCPLCRKHMPTPPGPVRGSRETRRREAALAAG